MDFRIADTFSDSLARLTSEEQKAIKTTAFDLQLNPASPGMSFHKLDKAKDKNFWSVRVSRDLRLIVHRTDASLLLCYVDHHDKAYAWAERRKLETHPKTGAAQWVEIRERVEQIVIPAYVAAASADKQLFMGVRDEEFLSYGVPQEWLSDVRGATEESLLAVADHLPREAAEALLELAVGGTPRKPTPAPVAVDPFEHPDAQRRFRVMANFEELQRALEFPWDKWTVFLHPEQRQWVERDYAGPARVSGSAGSERLFESQPGSAKLATPELIAGLLEKAVAAASGKASAHKFSRRFLQTEWEQVVDAWQLASWSDYRDVSRLGRKTRLAEAPRKALWGIFESVIAALAARKLVTMAGALAQAALALKGRKTVPFDFAVVDEAQDLGVPQLRFLASLARRPDALFFAGDTGQRIFQQPFSWKGLGVDVRGRSRTLRVNYRTSHQIRAQADRLLDAELADADGNADSRKDTVSVFNGPPAQISVFKSADAEVTAVGAWLAARAKAGVAASELGVFVRSVEELDRARAAVAKAGLPRKVLDEPGDAGGSCVSISTMHRAKGLEFRAVAVMACDDEIIPSQQRIEAVGDDADLQDVYDTERQLLYVALTRARDELLVIGLRRPPSSWATSAGSVGWRGLDQPKSRLQQRWRGGARRGRAGAATRFSHDMNPNPTHLWPTERESEMS